MGEYPPWRGEKQITQSEIGRELTRIARIAMIAKIAKIAKIEY